MVNQQAQYKCEAAKSQSIMKLVGNENIPVLLHLLWLQLEQELVAACLVYHLPANIFKVSHMTTLNNALNAMLTLICRLHWSWSSFKNSFPYNLIICIPTVSTLVSLATSSYLIALTNSINRPLIFRQSSMSMAITPYCQRRWYFDPPEKEKSTKQKSVHQ